MQYFESDVPQGNGLCSDDGCPCPEVRIPRGSGYLYVNQELVDFRKNYLTLVEARRAMSQSHQNISANLGAVTTFYRLGPILVCEQGAKLRNLNLKIAAEDAKKWWGNGLVPLRPTPTKNANARTFAAHSIEEAKSLAKSDISEDRIESIEVIKDVERKIEVEGHSEVETSIKFVKNKVPQEAFDVSPVEIYREGNEGVVEVEAMIESDIRVNQRKLIPEINREAYITKIECVIEPKIFLFGLIKVKGTWRVYWKLGFLHKISYNMPAVIEVCVKSQ